MKKCFTLAKKGIGNTSPNPLVGCIVLNKDGDIISTGYHKKYGDNHAERDALLKLKNGEEKEGTLIVNLEPCNHYGKTPPCTDLIIKRGIKKVVISSFDTNPKASGGIDKLKKAGIEVIEGILEKEGNALNEVFFTNINKKRTFIALKTATTIDGKIATNTGDSKWITSEKARNYAKKLRQNYDAILTSSSTIISDNPYMEHKNKIIIDRYLRCDLSSNIFQNGQIYIFTQKKHSRGSERSNIKYFYTPELTLDFILKELYKNNIMSLFVEAGGKLLGEFIKQGLYDKLYHFIAPKIINDNRAMSAFNGEMVDFISNAKQLEIVSIKRLIPDVLIEYNSRQT